MVSVAPETNTSVSSRGTCGGGLEGICITGFPLWLLEDCLCRAFSVKIKVRLLHILRCAFPFSNVNILGNGSKYERKLWWYYGSRKMRKWVSRTLRNIGTMENVIKKSKTSIAKLLLWPVNYVFHKILYYPLTTQSFPVDLIIFCLKKFLKYKGFLFMIYDCFNRIPLEGNRVLHACWLVECLTWKSEKEDIKSGQNWYFI